MRRLHYLRVSGEREVGSSRSGGGNGPLRQCDCSAARTRLCRSVEHSVSDRPDVHVVSPGPATGRGTDAGGASVNKARSRLLRLSAGVSPRRLRIATTTHGGSRSVSLSTCANPCALSNSPSGPLRWRTARTSPISTPWAGHTFAQVIMLMPSMPARRAHHAHARRAGMPSTGLRHQIELDLVEFQRGPRARHSNA